MIYYDFHQEWLQSMREGYHELTQEQVQERIKPLAPFLIAGFDFAVIIGEHSEYTPIARQTYRTLHLNLKPNEKVESVSYNGEDLTLYFTESEPFVFKGLKVEVEE